MSYKIITQSGKRIDLLKPSADAVDPADIQAALSKIMRFNGHTLYPYSVAQHSMNVASILPDALHVHALLHDAAEVYIGDIVRPMRSVLGGAVESIEAAWLRAVYERLRVPLDREALEEVQRADNSILRSELIYFFSYDEPELTKYDRVGPAEVFSFEYIDSREVELEYSSWLGGVLK